MGHTSSAPVKPRKTKNADVKLPDLTKDKAKIKKKDKKLKLDFVENEDIFGDNSDDDDESGSENEDQRMDNDTDRDDQTDHAQQDVNGQPIRHIKRSKIANKVINLGRDECCINGISGLSTNVVIVSDYKHGTLRIINMKKESIVCEVHLASRPWDVCHVTGTNVTQIAATLPDERKIMFLSLSGNKLLEDRKLFVKGECRGIIYRESTGIPHNDGIFILTFCNPGKVQIINNYGVVFTNIETDESNSRYFSDHLYYLSVSPDSSLIYVSDWGAHSVISFTPDGQLVAFYEDKTLVEPCGITVADSGTVFVCSRWSHTVHQLSPELIKAKIVLSTKDGISLPYCITYNDRRNKVAIGGKTLEVYKL